MFAKIKAYFSDLWAKVKADVANAMALLSTIFGSILTHIDAIAATLGDPNLNAQMATVFADAKWLGKWMLTVGILAAVAQFKKLVQTPTKD